MLLRWQKFGAAVCLGQVVTGLVIRAEDQSLDDQVSVDEPLSNSSLSVNTNQTLVALNGSLPLGEDQPPDFRIGVILKKQGKRLDRYDCWQALVQCAATMGLRDWEEDLASVSCNMNPDIRLTFTSNKPPLPMYETRSVLWSIIHLFNWWQFHADEGHPNWQELTFKTFWDADTVLGIGTVVSKAQQATDVGLASTGNVSLNNLAAIVARSPDDGQPPPGLNSVNASSDSEVEGPVPAAVQASPNEDVVNVGIGFVRNGKLVCEDVSYYRTILDMLVLIAEREADDPIGQGVQSYNPEEDFTFAIHATSKAAGEEGVLKHWMVLRALSVIAHSMEREPMANRFHEYIANIVIGPATGPRRGTRIVGKMIFLKGKHFTDEPLDYDVQPSNATGTQADYPAVSGLPTS